MHLPTIQWVLAYATTLLQLLLLVALLRGGHQSRFPVFCLYTGFSVVRAGAVLASWSLLGSYELYFYVYWISAPLMSLLGLAVIHEIYSDVLRSHPDLASSSTAVFCCAMLALVGTAWLVSLVESGSERSQLTAGLMAFLGGVRLVQAGLIMFLILLVRSLGLLWHGLSFSIALGFGLFASATAAAGIVRLYFGVAADAMNSFMITLAFFAATMVWVRAAFRRTETERFTVLLPLPELDAWNQSILRVLRR